MLFTTGQALQNCLLLLFLMAICLKKLTLSIVAFPRASGMGYLAALAMPLDLPNHNVYMAFNFEANYGLPANDSYYYWIDRWNLDEEFVGIGNDVIPVSSRRRRRFAQMYTRNAFYHSIVGYLEHYEMNGTGCLLRTICDVSATNLDEHNGLLGSIFKILFMPTTSAHEHEHQLEHVNVYAAEQHGLNGACEQYSRWCPHGLLELISEWL